MANAGKTIAGLGFGVALGAVIGVYALVPNLPGDNTGSVDRSVSETNSEQLEIAEAQLNAGDNFDLAFSSSLVADTLQDRPVLVLATHDADADDLEQLETILRAAGSNNAGTITLEESFFDQESADQLKNIISTTLPAGAQLSEERFDAGTHAGESLGSALMFNRETGEQLASVQDRALVLQSLRQEGFIDYEDGTILPASAIVLVTGNDDGVNAEYRSNNQAAFAQALATRGSGVVVTGRVKAASDTGVLGVLRSNEYANSGVSTVDSLERSWAKIAVVQAVVEQLEGRYGNYGVAAGTSGAAPGISRNLVSNSSSNAGAQSTEETTEETTTEDSDEAGGEAEAETAGDAASETAAEGTGEEAPAAQ